MSLRKKALSGVKWTTFSGIITTIVQFIQLVILARLLTPEDFGLVAMVLVVIGFAQLFADAGISGAIIHYQDISHKQLSSLYWLNIASGIVLFIVVIIISPAAVYFFDEPRLQNLFFLSAVIFLVVPIGQQYQVLLEKELNFNRIAKIEVAAKMFGAIIGISSALFGFGAASLIFAQLSAAMSKSFLLFVQGFARHKPEFYFEFGEIKEFIGFGVYRMGQMSLNYFNSRIDQLLIGKFLGATDLGYYNVAFNLVMLPVSRINPIITRVAFPVFARVQSDIEKLKKGFFETIKYLGLINFPLLIGLAAVAKPFVLTVYGLEWESSIVLVQILSFVALIRSIANPTGSLILAKGKPALGFKWNLFVFFITPPVIFLCSRFGILTVTVSLLVLQVIYFVLYYPFVLKPLLGNVKKEWFIDSFTVPLFYTLLMGVVVYLISSLTTFDLKTSLLIGIVSGVLIYASILFSLRKNDLMELKNLLANK